MPRSDQDNGSIFDGLNENAVTIVFGNLLNRYISVRQALQRTLPEDVQEEVDLSDINSVEMHPSEGSGEGIPDLIIRGHGFILVIEVKVKQDRDLTDPQKDAYIKWITAEIQDLQTHRGFVVFLVPDDYSHRVQLNSCLKEARRELCCSNNSNIQVLDPITWQQFVTELKSQDIPSLNELIREFYDYLYEKFKPVIFSTEEVSLMHSKETASGIVKLIDIVKKVNANFSNSEEFQSKKEITEDLDYGYELSPLKKKKFVYFGIWWELWAKKGSPLCIGILKDYNPQSMLESFQKKYKDRVMSFRNNDNKEWLVVGLCLEPDKNCSVLIETIVTNIETLLREDGSEESSEDAETP